MVDGLADLLRDISAGPTGDEPQPLSPVTLDEVSTHDFARYEFLLDPFAERLTLPPALTPDALDYLDDLQVAGASDDVLEYVGDVLIRMEITVRGAIGIGLTPRRPGGRLRVPTDTIVPTDDIARQVLRPLYRLHRRLIRTVLDLDNEFPDFFTTYLFADLRQQAQRIWSQATGSVATLVNGGYGRPLYDWVGFVERSGWRARTLDGDIDPVDLDRDIRPEFATYSAETVNVGIAVIYRQRWIPIGSQPGEIVRTIPLGPGQSEKIARKVLRRQKSSSTTENLTETESSTRTTDTSKTSSEVVKEAASSLNWSVSASANYGIGGFGASGSAQGGGSSSKNSKRTASKISEAMEESASKMRQQTKVVVSTEVESSTEESYTSEVRNTNDEVPLTLQYHTLQTMYDVYTYLHAVRKVVLVAETVPPPYRVNATWVRKHDWILVQELLDESFREALHELVHDDDTDALVEYGTSQDPYSTMLQRTIDKFASFDTPGNASGLGGLDVGDIYAQPQLQFDQHRREEESRRRANRLRAIQRERLYNHIRDNLLHYCRAIWAREDAEQRMLRYRREGRTVPYAWTSTIMGNRSEAFTPSEIGVPVDELIEDYKPVGFVGNYIAFALSPTASADLEAVRNVDVTTEEGEIRLPVSDVLDVMCAKYTNAAGTGLRDPAYDLFLEEANALAANNGLANLSDETVRDLVSYLPAASKQLIDANGVIRGGDAKLTNPVSAEHWAEYLLRRNGTRRFLVDSDNLYVSLLLGEGVALEPFKRAHRLIDVMRADEGRRADKRKNKRRRILEQNPQAFDPDIQKVVIAADVPGAAAHAAATAPAPVTNE